MAEEPPPDHESDQEDSKDDESSSKVNQRADRLEFVGEFQEMMNKAIDQAKRQAVSARRALENIQRVEDAGLSRNSPNYPGTPRVKDMHKNFRNDM